MKFIWIKTTILAVLFATTMGCHGFNSDPLAQKLGTKITVGMTKDDVDKTLTQLKVEHGFDDRANAYNVIFRNVPGSLLFEKYIYYQILFDSDERVKDIKKEEGYDAP
jgi:hypothetical protein